MGACYRRLFDLTLSSSGASHSPGNVIGHHFLLLLGTVRMLLSKLSPESGDFSLQCRHLGLVLLRHLGHAGFHIPDVLPHIDSLVAHDLTYAATATCTVA
jgi:hypothetical protein